jgi:hypothetical protein
MPPAQAHHRLHTQRIAPHRTAPHRTAPHRTASHRIARGQRRSHGFARVHGMRKTAHGRRYLASTGRGVLV